MRLQVREGRRIREAFEEELLQQEEGGGARLVGPVEDGHARVAASEHELDQVLREGGALEVGSRSFELFRWVEMLSGASSQPKERM